MKKVKETTNGNGNKNGSSTNGNKSKKEVIKEFNFAEAESSKAVRSMIKVMTMTRKRLYPERYDEKGNLKPEYAKNKVII